jgi:hypothetical protein
MSDFQPRPLHLHTLDSLCADLVSGRAISVGTDGTLFSLPNDRTRSALQWYRKRGAENWSAAVNAQHGEQLVDAILAPPPNVTAFPVGPANANGRRLTLKKVEAHRFAGLHKFGTLSQAPENYVHEFSAPITLFEGANGSGKTSLINAIIWALTGEILRAQREPEKASEEFECWIAATNGGLEQTTHRLTPVTPLPHPEEYRPEQNWVPADTWVELTFEDEGGATLPLIRRSQTRTAQGKLVESPPDLAALGVDPIAIRIGTLMPGILPLIRVGSAPSLAPRTRSAAS